MPSRRSVVSTMRRSLMRQRFAGHLACWLCELTVLACLVNPARVLAQTAPPESLTINDAIQSALKNYPAIRERRAPAQAAVGTIRGARTAYLPPLDIEWPAEPGPNTQALRLSLP